MNATNESGPARHPADPAAIPPPPMPIPCRKCRQGIGAADAFCKHCGTRQQVSDPFYYHPVWILVLALTVLGPFALGLVWRSRVMSPATKAVLAAIIVAYSAVTFYSVYVLGDILYRELSFLDQVM